MVKLKDIAQDVGVSISMVSRALNPNSDRKISESLKKKVSESAFKLGFKQNRIAEFLKKGKSPVLGIFIPGFNNRLVADLMIGMSQKAAQMNFPLNFYFTSPNNYRNEFRNFIDGVKKSSNSGIITYVYEEQEEKEVATLLNEYLENGGHAILINTDKKIDGIAKICNDDSMGGRLAAECLARHKPAAMLCEDSIFFRRTEGFMEKATSLGHQPVLYTIDSFEQTLDTFSGTKSKTSSIGVFSCTDINAVALMKMAKARGLIPGNNIFIVGYDDLELCEFTEPRLTTIRQDFAAEGRRAVEKLVNLIYGGKESDELIPTSLVIRESA